MYFYYLTVALAALGQVSFCRSKINAIVNDASLDIYSEPGDETDTIVIKKVDELLQLRCEKQDLFNNYKNRSYELVWTLPSNNSTSSIRVSNGGNQTTLIIQNLQIFDMGYYECIARSNIGEGDVSVIRYLTVRPEAERPKNCAPKMFVCEAGTRNTTLFCIPKHYVCDGRVDCPGTGDDESVDTCGTKNSCYGKLPCSDGRCIPNSWCCDPRSSQSKCYTRVRPRCCDEHTNEDFPDPKFQQVNEERHQLTKEVGFLQTTVYTITVCAIVFLVAVILLVAAIAKMHRKRTVRRRYPQLSDNNNHPSQMYRSPSIPVRLIQMTGGMHETEPSSDRRPSDFGNSYLSANSNNGLRVAPLDSNAAVGCFNSPESPTRNIARGIPRVLNNGYSSPLFYDGGNSEYIFGEMLSGDHSDNLHSGRDSNLSHSPLDQMEFFANDIQRQRALRRVNALERILDRLGINDNGDLLTANNNNHFFITNTEPLPPIPERQPPVLRIGRLRVTLPRIFGRNPTRRRRVPAVPLRNIRPGTQIIPNVNTAGFNVVHFDGSDTYTLNGRTILLGATFMNGGLNRINSPPSYMEAVGDRVPVEFLPPPPYVSMDDIVHQTADSATAESPVVENVSSAAFASFDGDLSQAVAEPAETLVTEDNDRLADNPPGYEAISASDVTESTLKNDDPAPPTPEIITDNLKLETTTAVAADEVPKNITNGGKVTSETTDANIITM